MPCASPTDRLPSATSTGQWCRPGSDSDRGSTSRHRVPGRLQQLPSRTSSNGAEEAAHLVDERLGLLEGGEVPAAVELLVPTDVRVPLLAPAPRRSDDLARVDRDAGRHGDGARVAGAEALPVEAGGRCRGRREPVHGDVVEHLLLRERLLRVSVTVGPRPELLRDPRTLARGRIGEAVAECLWSR